MYKMIHSVSIKKALKENWNSPLWYGKYIFKSQKKNWKKLFHCYLSVLKKIVRFGQLNVYKNIVTLTSIGIRFYCLDRERILRMSVWPLWFTISKIQTKKCIPITCPKKKVEISESKKYVDTSQEWSINYHNENIGEGIFSSQTRNEKVFIIVIKDHFTSVKKKKKSYIDVPFFLSSGQKFS